MQEILTGVHPNFPGKERLTTVQWDATDRIKAVRTYGADRTSQFLEVAFDYYPATNEAARRVQWISFSNRSPHGVANQLRRFTFAYKFHPSGIVKEISVDGPRSGTTDKTTSTFNAFGDLLSIKDAAGNTITYSEHNGLGLPATVTEVTGLVTKPIYNEIGQAISATQKYPVGDLTTTFEYHPLGMLNNVTRLNGQIFNGGGTAYDPRGIPKAAASLGGQVKYDSNSQGLITDEGRASFDLPFLYARSWEYDEIGRMTAEKRGYDQYQGVSRERTEQSYDENGNVREIRQIGTPNRVTTLAYNSHNELIKVTGPIAGEEVSYDYDAGGRLSFVKDAKGIETRYHFDGFGNLIRQISADTGTTTFEYETPGTLKTVTRQDGSKTTYTYDDLDRPKTVTAGTSQQSFTYDTCLNGKGRLCTITDGTGSIAYTYTLTGQLATQVTVNNGTTYTTSWGYDGLDRMTTLTYPGGTQAIYRYDASDYANRVQVKIGASTLTLADNVRHQPFGPITTFDFGNGLTRGAGHDLDYRVKSLSSPGASLDYDYTEFGELWHLNNSASTTLSQTFTYDRLSRLKSVNNGTGNQGLKQIFAYDKNGNRDSHTRGAEVDDYVLLAAKNRFSSITGPRTRTYGHDPRGNIETESGWRGSYKYTYDPLNRLTAFTKGTAVTTYRVNALNQRVRKEGAGGNFNYLYDPSGSLLAETKTGQTTLSTLHVWLYGELIGVVRDGVLYYVSSDHLGRPIEVRNQAKTVVWQANASAFDRTVSVNNFGGLNLGFPGQYYDAESGNWYNLNRYYDANTGRYTQPDPIGLAGGLNPYAYVGSNPLSFVDPTGLQCAFGPGNVAFDFVFGFIPGYDLAAAAGNPDATGVDYAIGVLGVVPGVGKAAGVGLKLGTKAATGIARGGAQAGGITAAEARRIQNAANRIGKPINLVGSRARGPVASDRDYDYVIDASARVRNSVQSSLPGAGNIREGIRPNIDVFKGQPDPSRPSIRFEPEGP